MYQSAIIRVMESGFLKETEEAVSVCRGVLEDHGYSVCKRKDVCSILTDLKDSIYALSRESDLVVILGGTGFLKEDNSPESVLSIVDKRATSFEVAMTINALKHDSELVLYRTVAGAVSNSMILCIPGLPDVVPLFLKPVLEPLKKLIDSWKDQG